MLKRPTWILPARSGSSLIAKIPRLAQDVAATGCLDGIDVTEHVRDGHVGRRELLHVALLATDPRDGRVVAVFFDELAAVLRDRRERIVVHLASGNDRQRLVEQEG
jgi:hypothetical protein